MVSALMRGIATVVIVGLPMGAMARHPSIDGQPLQIEGQPVDRASSEVLIKKEVIEFREGGSDVVRLLPGDATYRVCVESPRLIPAVEAACAPESEDPYVDIVVEDGRGFERCLVETSTTVYRFWRPDCTLQKPGTRYCFRCEGIQ